MSNEEEIVLGKGGGGHGGGHHGGGHHHGRGGRGSGFGGPLPWIYDVPQGIDVDELLDAADAVDAAQNRSLAKEVVRQLRGQKATLGEDLDLLDAVMLGDDDSEGKKKDSGKGGGGGGGMFGDFGLSSIFNLAGNLAQTGLNIADSEKQKQQAQQTADAAKAKTTADDRNKLNAVLAADAAASQAAAKAAYSAQGKLASAPIDASAAQQAAQMQARAGMGLSPAVTDQRLDAAQKALAQATAKAQANPKDGYAVALMNAWQATLNKIQNVQITGPESGGGKAGKGGKGGGSWLDGKTGPVPNKVVAGAGVLAAGGLLVKVLLR